VGVLLELEREPVDVETERRRVAQEVLGIERALVREEKVVHLPEASLGAGGLGGLGSLERMQVDLAERKIAKREPQIVAEDLSNLHDGRMRGSAVGALEVTVLDERDGCCLGAENVIALADRDCEPRGMGGCAQADTPAGVIASSAARIPSAPGLTPIGDT